MLLDKYRLLPLHARVGWSLHIFVTLLEDLYFSFVASHIPILADAKFVSKGYVVLNCVLHNYCSGLAEAEMVREE